MFRLLGGIQGEIDDIHREMHGGGEGEETNGGGFPFPGGFPAIFGGNNPDFDLNNSTYEEKVNILNMIYIKMNNLFSLIHHI